MKYGNGLKKNYSQTKQIASEEQKQTINHDFFAFLSSDLILYPYIEFSFIIVPKLVTISNKLCPL
jgi:hypothetical protein